MKALLTAMSLIAVPILVVAVGERLRGQTEQGQPLRYQISTKLMQSKLDRSKDVLGGLATENFDAISRGAKAMRDLGALEGWVRADTPRYKAQLNVFYYANDALIKASQDRNLDGAALAYSQLTLSCVNCHKLVRSKD